MHLVKLILWDWNGCLLDDVPHRFEHGPCAIFRHYGLPAPTLEDYTHNITSDFMSWYYARGIPDSGDRKRDGDALNAIMKAQMATAQIPPLFPETRAVLEKLRARNLRQALVSSLEATEFERQLGHHALQDYFVERHGGIRKKAPVFLDILARHGVDASEAVGVTDTMSDVRELAEVGVKPILVPRGYVVPDTNVAPNLVVAEDLWRLVRDPA